MFGFYLNELVITLMDKFDRIQLLHRIFTRHSYPVSISKLAEELECSARTVKVAIDLLRDQLQAPLEYYPEQKGWQYDESGSDKFELPGIWLTSNELHGLATILYILQTIDEGLLGKDITVVQQHISKLFSAKGIAVDDFSRFVNYIPTNKHPVISHYFSAIADALIHTKQLSITYNDYAGKSSQRMLSPQKLIYYQENWYLDAWCHKRDALRSFMLSRISHLVKQTTPATIIPEADIIEHFQTSYGIFAGKPKHTAVIKFYSPVAREAAAISWHPEQESEWMGKEYQISFPYNDDRELVRDIMKYGSHVEVIKPAALKNKIKRVAQSIVGIYE